LKRRTFLQRGAAALAAASPLARAWSGQAPGIITRDGARPSVPCGASTGDVNEGRAIVWSRTDRPARMIVDYSTKASFTDVRRVIGPAAMEDSDFTARIDLLDLPPGQRISYRVLFQDLSDLRTYGVPAEGSFQTPSLAAVCSSTKRCDAPGPMCSFISATRSTPTSRSSPR